MKVFAAALVVAALALAQSISAQPYAQLPPERRAVYQQGITEPVSRNMSAYEGFIFDFNTATPSDITPSSSIKQNQVASNPFLSTLPGDGNGQTLVTLGPCSGNTPHTHPRGSEISTLLYGTIEFGMIEENAEKNVPIIGTMVQNSTAHVPQGVLHFSFNPNCEPAAFLANFATRDPGTQTIWNSMMRVPTHILHSATGIPERLINGLKQYPQVTAPGTGSEECLRRCNIDFNRANNLTALTPDEILP